MNKRIFLPFWVLLLNLLVFSSCQTKPTLVLNFDLNSTLMIEDAAGGKDENLALLTLVAKNTYGKWGSNQETSYYDHVKATIEVKAEQNKKFLSFIKDYDLQYKGQLDRDFKALKKARLAQKTIVFESFFHLLDYLAINDLSYHLVLRTFGEDLDKVSAAIEKVRGFKFVKGEFQNKNLVMISENKTITKPSEIAKVLNETPLLAIKDEYKPWKLHDEDWHFGKIFFYPIVKQADETLLPLFFDDNIEHPGAKKGIVRPVMVRNEIMEVKNPDTLLGTQIFRVDTKKALLDKNYFIDLVKTALRAYNKAQ